MSTAFRKPPDFTFSPISKQFQSEETARECLEKLRWPEGPVCPHCGEIGNARKNHRFRAHRCGVACDGSKAAHDAGNQGALRRRFERNSTAIQNEAHQNALKLEL